MTRVAWGCLIAVMVVPACRAADRHDLVIADFEGPDYAGWVVTGDAFGTGPAHGTLPGQQPVSGFLGKGLVNTFRDGDRATGTLTSPPFTVERRYINLLVGGGHHPGEACVNLLIDGKVVHTATGTGRSPADDEHLSGRTWDVSAFAGQQARIEIVDRHTGGWGHINVDQITQSDRRAVADLGSEPLTEANASVQGAAARAQADPARPVIHVMPPALWCNDPNGPVYHNGFYHLFYQLNPFGDRWDHMHWGHARSRDLVHWEHLPVALAPSAEKGEDHCFSGCCVIDDRGRPVIVYTSIGRRAPEQWAAVGSDDLLTWTKHRANPLLTTKLHGDTAIEEWRDPFVFREAGRWYMVCGGHRAGGKGCIALYASDDLEKWRFLGIPFEGSEANWECPNLFKLGGQWVLIYSPHGPVRYYTGDLDLAAVKFTPRYHGTLDPSDNYYAPNGLADARGRRLEWGWVRGFPGGRGWNGCLTLPRVLTVGDGGRLLQRPAPELEKLRGPALPRVDGLRLDGSARVLEGIRGDTLEIRAEIEPVGAAGYGLRLRRSADGSRAVTIRYDGKQLDVAGVKVPLELPAGRSLALHVFLDRSVLEVFAGDGAVAVARVFDAPADQVGVEAFAEGGPAVVKSLEAWPVGSIGAR